MTNANVPMVDLPFFELCNQAPAASSALSGLCTAETSDDRYMYYMTGSNFYRYDKVADTFQKLATPPTAPVTILSMKMTKRRGYHGRVLSATSNGVTLPGLRQESLDGEKIQILQGTGQGQERTLTFVSETIHDTGVITGTATNYLQDTTKKWIPNQYAGYMVGITFGTDATQYKKILYNDANTLYISDVNLMPHDPWNNQAYVAAAPYALPVTTAGSQAHYVIMSSTYTVDSAWTTIPDYSSFFTTLTGGIYLVSSAAAAPFFTLQYYDILHDSWQTKTVPQSLILAALGTDVALERTGKIGSALATKVGTVSATNRTLTDAGQALTPNFYNNHRLLITSGTGAGQSRRIVAHTATTFTVPRNWDTNPDSTSVYEIWPDFDRLYMVGGAAAAMYAYSPENDYWMQGQAFDDGIANTISCTMKGWAPISVASGARIAAGVQAINPVPTAGGTNYVVGDQLTCSVGGTGAVVVVTSVNAGGVVTGLALVNAGTATGFTTGTGKATTNGSGSGCTIEITAVGPTALITTSTAHWFKRGDSVTFAGCSEGLWNAAHTIIGVSSTSMFSVSTTATASMATAAVQSTTLLVDASKNWVVNEHVGRLVHIMVAGTAPTSQVRVITANTANTLTVAAITAATNGSSKYVIYDSKVFGIAEMRKETDKAGVGNATGGSTTTLIDSTKNWIPNQWIGFKFRVEAGTGYGSGQITITANSATTLTYTTQTFTPDATTRYEIADTWGVITTGGTTTPVTDTSKAWGVNQFAGKRFRITGGTAMGQESAVTSNTATAITVGTALTATDTTSTYAILEVPARAAGIDLVWTFGATKAAKKKSMYCPRGGGSNTMDIYDVSTGKWNQFGTFMGPQGETFNTGSSYAYDGADGIIASVSAASSPIRIFKYNLKTNKVDGYMTTTMLNNAIHVGNNIQILDSPDGSLSYLYALQNTGTQLCRALIF